MATTKKKRFGGPVSPVFLIILSLFIFSGWFRAALFSQETGPADAGLGQAEHATIKEISYPVFPGAKPMGATYISASFYTPEAPEAVKSWYDRYMPKEGWRFIREWESRRQRYWKNYLRGEAPGTQKNIAEQMVKIRLEPNEDRGGTTIEIIPLEIRIKY